MKIKLKDLDPVQVDRMRSVYGMSDEQIVAAAQQIVDPTPEKTRPSRRARRFFKS